MGIGKKDLPSAEFIAFETTRHKERTNKLKRIRGEKTSDEFQSTDRGVVFLQNLPYGFEEKQIHDYFSQFGTVTRFKLARNEKNGDPLGSAHVEFFHAEVAKIVAETMNNYLMFDCCLKCHVVPPEELDSDVFAAREYKQRSTDFKKSRKEINVPLTPEQVETRKEELKKTLDKLKLEMKVLGVEYEWGDLQANPDFVPPNRIKTDPELQKKMSELKAKPVSIRKELEEWINDFDFCENHAGRWNMDGWMIPKRKLKIAERKAKLSKLTKENPKIKRKKRKTTKN